MGLIFKTEKRRVIPKWRSIEVAGVSGELNVSSTVNISNKFNLDLLSQQNKSFKNNRDLSHAGDLISAAYVLGLENEFEDVAKFILEKSTNHNELLVKIANKILKINKEPDNFTNPVNTDIRSHLKYRFDIRKYRAYLNQETKNPIAWIELARLYSLIGRIDKAKRCIDAALFLDTDNRFIVRSASRFYHHYITDTEAALTIIKKSAFSKVDPWLLSAEIAYSSILDRHSTYAKTGIEFLKTGKYKNFEIAELASSLGTLEFFHGKYNDSKKYFSESLLKPNDNSLAQTRWMSDFIPGFNVDISKYNLPLAFEATALESLENDEYQKSYDNSMNWINDEPYSTRPVKLASYISSVFLDDNERCISLLKEGLLVNPNDIILNNNLVYFLMRGNYKEEAIKIYQHKLRNRFLNIDKGPRLIVTATTGLLLYRDGHRDQGKKFYQKSIELARETNNEYLIALATVNYIKEEVKFIENKNELTREMSYFEKYFKIHISPDIKIFYNEFLHDYEKLEDR